MRRFESRPKHPPDTVREKRGSVCFLLIFHLVFPFLFFLRLLLPVGGAAAPLSVSVALPFLSPFCSAVLLFSLLFVWVVLSFASLLLPSFSVLGFAFWMASLLGFGLAYPEPEKKDRRPQLQRQARRPTRPQEKEKQGQLQEAETRATPRPRKKANPRP